MGKMGRRFALCCLAALLLAGTASANSAPPDYLVAVKVSNGPGGLYYLDLLAEGSGAGDGLAYSYSEEEIQSLDSGLLEDLRGAAQEGWFPCTLGSYRDFQVRGDLEGKDGVHAFRGYDLPRRFRILIVTEDGESWTSETLERDTLQMSVRLDWSAKTVRVPPVWMAYALQFLSTLLPTLLIEWLVLLLFQYGWRENWKVFLLVNLVTQGLLAAFLSQGIVKSGLTFYSAAILSLLLIPAELVILLVELFIYRRLLRGHSKGRAAGYAVAANLASYGLGWFVVQAVWEHVTRLFWLGI